jgi:predicted kinase
MAYIIILTGIPASGKTTFSGYLSKELGIPVISKDVIKEILYEDIGFHSREEKVRLGVASMNIMYHMAEESMKLGNPVILENNFENVSKPRLTKLIEQYGYQLINIRFEGDISIIYDRFVQRDQSDKRHLGHVINDCYPPEGPVSRVTKMTLEDYRNMIISRGILDFDIGGDVLSVNTTDLNKVNYQEVINEVKKLFI